MARGVRSSPATPPLRVYSTVMSVRLFRLSLLACAAALPAAAQDTFIAPTRSSIIATSEQSYSSEPGHMLYVINRSTVPVVVFGISFSDCENIRQSCSGQRLNILIEPGDRRQVGRVTARDAHKEYRYHWGYSFRADSSNARAIAMLREHGLTVEGTPLAPTVTTRSSFDSSQGALSQVPASPSVVRVMDRNARETLAAPEPRDSAPAAKFRLKVAYGSILGSTMMPGAPIQRTGPCVNPAESAAYERDAKIARTPWRPPVLPPLRTLAIPSAYVDSARNGADVLVRFAIDTTGEAIPMSASVLESPFGVLSVSACQEAIAAKGTPARDKNGQVIRAWMQLSIKAR